MPEITSVQNTHVKYLQRLYQKNRLRRTDGKFIIDNPKIIYHLLGKPAPSVRITELLYTANYSESSPTHLPSENLRPATSITKAVLEKIIGPGSNPGLLAVAEFSEDKLFTKSLPNESILVLDHLQDPGNVGTLIRSAHGAGLNHLCFVGTSVDILNPKVIRASMGSFAYLTYSILSPDQAQVLGVDHTVVGADGSGATPYQKWSPPQTGQPLALCIGSEAAGLCAPVQSICHAKLAIPLNPNCESLNAAAAGAILLFHLFGQES